MIYLSRNKTGFTLIELFIAISIFSVVAIALYSTFFAGISVWKRSGESENIYQSVKFLLDDIAKDLKNVIYYTKDAESIFVFLGKNDEIVFITLEDTSQAGDMPQKELVKVVYMFDSEIDALIRIRAEKSSGFSAEKAEKEVLLKGIKDFKFEYCYDSGDEDEPYLWKEEWEDKDSRIPRGVRVSFLIKTEKEKKELKFTKTMFVPIGVLGEEEVGL